MSEIPIHTLTIEHAKADEPFCTLGKHDFVLYADHLKELEGLRADVKSLEESLDAQFAKFEGCPHKPIEEGLCGCSFDRIGDVCAHHAPALAKAQCELEALREQCDEFKRQRDIVLNSDRSKAMDELRAQLRSKDEQLAGMRDALEPVTDEEMWAFSLHQIDVVQPYRKLPVLTLSQVNKLFASRLSGPSPAQEGTCKTS